MEILVSCMGYASSRGHNDFGDRRFYPTPADIKHIAESRRGESR